MDSRPHRGHSRPSARLCGCCGPACGPLHRLLVLRVAARGGTRDQPGPDVGHAPARAPWRAEGRGRGTAFAHEGLPCAQRQAGRRRACRAVDQSDIGKGCGDGRKMGLAFHLRLPFTGSLAWRWVARRRSAIDSLDLPSRSSGRCPSRRARSATFSAIDGGLAADVRPAAGALSFGPGSAEVLAALRSISAISSDELGDLVDCI